MSRLPVRLYYGNLPDLASLAPCIILTTRHIVSLNSQRVRFLLWPHFLITYAPIENA